MVLRKASSSHGIVSASKSRASRHSSSPQSSPPTTLRGVDDDDGRAAGIRVDIDQSVEPDVEAGFFARFADRGGGELLAAVHVAARKHPEPVARLDRPPHQHEARVRRLDDRADRDLGIEIEDETAPRAHQPVRIAGLEAPRLEGAPAGRAEAVLHSSSLIEPPTPDAAYEIIEGHVDPEGRAHGPPGAADARQAHRSIGDHVAARPAAHRRHVRDDAGVSGDRPRRAAGPRGPAPLRRRLPARSRRSLARSARRRRRRAADGADQSRDHASRHVGRRGLGRLPEHSRHSRQGAARDGDRGERLRPPRARIEIRRAGVSPPASFSTRPITSTACCSSIG